MKVALLEDNKATQKLLKLAFKNCDINIDVLCFGLAEDLFHCSYEFDIVVIDHSLEGFLTGTQFLKKYKKKFPRTFFVACSSDHLVTKVMFEKGAHAMLIQPFTKDDIGKLLQQYKALFKE